LLGQGKGCYVSFPLGNVPAMGREPADSDSTSNIFSEYSFAECSVLAA
jgi:hypothetical protein